MKHVQDNAARALQSPNSLGVIQGSGPMLDAYVVTLVAAREALTTAMRMLLCN